METYLVAAGPLQVLPFFFIRPNHYGINLPVKQPSPDHPGCTGYRTRTAVFRVVSPAITESPKSFFFSGAGKSKITMGSFQGAFRGI
jgi:hypothetical protein